MRKIIFSLLLAVCLHPAFAYFVDGNKLSEWSSANARIQSNRQLTTDFQADSFFNGYVMGVYDAFDDVLICAPQTVEASQAGAIVRKYLVDHPERWAEPAHQIVSSALSQIFPCAK